MAEVERRQVERVDHEHQLADPEIGVHPQKDKRRREEVVHDEVRANIRSDLDQLGIEGEEVVEVAEL